MVATALVLSAGGMFAAWEAGVWNVLHKRVRPDMIVGASAGAWNAWVLAGGGTTATNLQWATISGVGVTLLQGQILTHNDTADVGFGPGTTGGLLVADTTLNGATEVEMAWSTGTTLTGKANGYNTLAVGATGNTAGVVTLGFGSGTGTLTVGPGTGIGTLTVGAAAAGTVSIGVGTNITGTLTVGGTGTGGACIVQLGATGVTAGSSVTLGGTTTLTVGTGLTSLGGGLTVTGATQINNTLAATGTTTLGTIGTTSGRLVFNSATTSGGSVTLVAPATGLASLASYTLTLLPPGTG